MMVHCCWLMMLTIYFIFPVKIPSNPLPKPKNNCYKSETPLWNSRVQFCQ